MDPKKLSLIGVIAFIGLLYLIFRLLSFPAGLFCTTFIGGFVLWLATTYRTRINPEKIILPYLVTVILFITHVFEEFSTHIELVMTRLTGLQVTQKDFLTIAAFIAPVIWLLGAVMTLKQWHFGFFLMSVFLFGMMFGELSHFAFPFLLDGRFHYVSGMYTAILPSASAWWFFFITLREMRESKTDASTAVI